MSGSSAPKGSKRAAAKGTPKANKDFTPSEFVTWTLTKEQAAQCKTWLTALDEYDDMLGEVLLDGYKFTVKYDSYNNAWAAWLIPLGTNDPNTGYILSGRGSTPAKAIKQAMFIHLAVFERDWAAWANAPTLEPLDD